jgi:hypothetical protein
MAAVDRQSPDRADLIVRNAKVTSLQDGGSAVAEAIAVRGERFAAVGSEAEVTRLAGEGTRVVDVGGRRLSRAERLAPARDPRGVHPCPGRR